MARRPSRRALLRRPAIRSPLAPDEVFAVVASQAHTMPLPTTDIAEVCGNLYGYPGITTDRVRKLLVWLEGRGRIRSWNGGSDEDHLRRLGVNDPLGDVRYWALPPPEGTP